MRIILNEAISNMPQDILADVYYPEESNGKLVLFCHGFKGFKDWGAWHLVAEAFANAGFVFVKFNFSQNGVDLENLEEFRRLDLFFENNYSKEIEEVETVLNWIDNDVLFDGLNLKTVNIIGHSRGGGIALQAAANDKRIDKVVTWASISNFNRFGSADVIEDWRKTGKRNFYNGRTKQNMEIGFQFYENYMENQDKLNLEKTLRQLKKVQLIIHGKSDDAVGHSHAQRMKVWHPEAELILIENANHVFGAKHPCLEKELPKDLQKVVEETLRFLA